MSLDLLDDQLRIRSNPVLWCRDALRDWPSPDAVRKILAGLQKEGIGLPATFLSELKRAGMIPVGLKHSEPARRGPVGLTVTRARNEERRGIVVPLIVETSSEWRVAETLPFDADVLQRAMGHLFAASGLAAARLRPSLFPHRIVDGYGKKAAGESMTVAGVLAVLAATSRPRSTPLDGAAAVVAPGEGRADVDRLFAVREVPLKLRAFVREFDRGTLLIRSADCAEPAEFDGHFDEVWLVRSWEDLARRLDAIGVLEPFRRTIRLDPGLADRALARLRVMIDEAHDYGEAHRILLEVAQLRPTATLSREIARKFVSLRNDVERHRGYLDRGVRFARDELSHIDRAGDASTHDDRARAAANYAAALYDAHRFDEADMALLSWSEAIDSDPRAFSPLARVMVWNTLGRVRVMTGGADWAQWFARSLEIQRRVSPADQHRTLCSLVHGLLRHGQLVEASRLLTRNPPEKVTSEFSRYVLDFARADLARRRGKVWSAPSLDSSPRAVAEGFSLPFGLYLQASARQSGRQDDDALARLEKARVLFLHQCGEDATGNLLVFLAWSMDLARAARSGDVGLWQSARDRLRAFTRTPHGLGLGRHHRDPLGRLGSEPDPDRAEALLSGIPYF